MTTDTPPSRSYVNRLDWQVSAGYIDHSQATSEGRQTAAVGAADSDNDQNAYSDIGQLASVNKLVSSTSKHGYCTLLSRSYLETFGCEYHTHFYKLLDQVYEMGKKQTV